MEVVLHPNFEQNRWTYFRLTPNRRLQHPRGVLRPLGRFAALTMVLVLVGGHLAECPGWLATAEARMACCANEQECPMHKAGQHSSGSRQLVSQSDADRCCATSERGESMPTSVKANAVDGPALIPTSLSGVLVSPATWFDNPIERVSGPPASRSRHVLLSVFLI
jgi:hypothetical protein